LAIFRELSENSIGYSVNLTLSLSPFNRIKQSYLQHLPTSYTHLTSPYLTMFSRQLQRAIRPASGAALRNAVISQTSARSYARPAAHDIRQDNPSFVLHAIEKTSFDEVSPKQISRSLNPLLIYTHSDQCLR
jgi:hypothetical protein